MQGQGSPTKHLSRCVAVRASLWRLSTQLVASFFLDLTAQNRDLQDLSFKREMSGRWPLI